LQFGYDAAEISGAVGSLENVFIEPWGLSETAANSGFGYVVSRALIGCITGGILGSLEIISLFPLVTGRSWYTRFFTFLLYT